MREKEREMEEQEAEIEERIEGETVGSEKLKYILCCLHVMWE